MSSGFAGRVDCTHGRERGLQAGELPAQALRVSREPHSLLSVERPDRAELGRLCVQAEAEGPRPAGNGEPLRGPGQEQVRRREAGKGTL